MLDSSILCGVLSLKKVGPSGWAKLAKGHSSIVNPYSRKDPVAHLPWELPWDSPWRAEFLPVSRLRPETEAAALRQRSQSTDLEVYKGPSP